MLHFFLAVDKKFSETRKRKVPETKNPATKKQKVPGTRKRKLPENSTSIKGKLRDHKSVCP